MVLGVRGLGCRVEWVWGSDIWLVTHYLGNWSPRVRQRQLESKMLPRVFEIA